MVEKINGFRTKTAFYTIYDICSIGHKTQIKLWKCSDCRTNMICSTLLWLQWFKNATNQCEWTMYLKVVEDLRRTHQAGKITNGLH